MSMQDDGSGLAAARERLHRLALGGQLDVAMGEAGALAVSLPEGGLARAGVAFQCALYGFAFGAAREALGFASEAAVAARAQGAKGLEVRAVALGAWLHLECGAGERAAEEAINALRLAGEDCDAVSQSWALNVMGVVYWYCLQLERAEAFCARAVALARTVRDPVLIAWWLVNLGGTFEAQALVARRRGHVAEAEVKMAEARRLIEESLQYAERGGDVWCQVLCLQNLAETELEGDVEQASAWLARVNELPGAASDRLLAHRLMLEGGILLDRGRPAEALRLIEESVSIAERTGNPPMAMSGLQLLPRAHEMLGGYREALAAYKRFHAVQQQIADERVQQRARMLEQLLEFSRLNREIASAMQQRAEIARSHERLQAHAQALAEDVLRDPLTGVGNRRRLEEALDALAAFRAENYVIVMIDVDQFKAINDRYSHVIGDKVLVEVARTILLRSRQSDVVARYGGEEFALLMANTSEADARGICERIRRALKRIVWPAGLEGVNVTASFGIAAAGEAAGGAREILKLADARMYEAKRAGRDRVVGRVAG